MRQSCVRTWISCLALLTAAGCTLAPRGTPPSSVLVPTDPRTLAYGRTNADLLANPEIGGKIRDLFGADWRPASVAGGSLALGAEAYFDQGGPTGVVRVGDADYIAVSGCAPRSCASRHVLLLIQPGGTRLLARLDEGGFVHYYGYGNDVRSAEQPIMDSALHALYRGGNPYPSGRS